MCVDDDCAVFIQVYSASAVSATDGTVVFQIPIQAMQKLTVNRIKAFELTKGETHDEVRAARISKLKKGQSKAKDLMNLDLATAADLHKSIEPDSNSALVKPRLPPMMKPGISADLQKLGLLEVKEGHDLAAATVPPPQHRRIHAEYLYRVQHELHTKLSTKADDRRSDAFVTTKQGRICSYAKIPPSWWKDDWEDKGMASPEIALQEASKEETAAIKGAKRRIELALVRAKVRSGPPCSSAVWENSMRCHSAVPMPEDAPPVFGKRRQHQRHHSRPL